MIIIKINNTEYCVNSNISILEACCLCGFLIPRFCYHEMLSISGNCRMCLVEVEGNEKPVASCVSEVDKGLSIWLNSPFVKKARENVLEMILLNHPLDCPICDQAGECDLQDQTSGFSSPYSRYFNKKREVGDKEISVLIKTIMTRCIHCTRCVRFFEEIAGVPYLGTLARGKSTEIGNYSNNYITSNISSNVIDLCPVGALTSKAYAFKARPWEVKHQESMDISDGYGSTMYINFKDLKIVRVLSKANNRVFNLLTDKARHLYSGNNNNRIKNIFIYDLNIKKYIKTTYIVFNEMLCNSNNNINIIVNNSVGVIKLNDINNGTFLNRVRVFTINSFRAVNIKFTNKFYIPDILNKKIDAYILLSTNLQVECAILGHKIRYNSIHRLCDIYETGQYYDSTYAINFTNLKFNTLLNILVGKHRCKSKNLKKYKYTMLLFGMSITNRINNLHYLKKMITIAFLNIKSIDINITVNERGFDYYSIKSYNKKSLNDGINNILLSVEDTVFIRKWFFKKKNNFWINSHGSELATSFKYIVPALSAFEQSELYINIEGKVQKSNRIIKQISDISNPFKILKILGKNKNNSQKWHIYMLKQVSKKRYINSFPIKKSSKFAKDSDNYVAYPLKSVISDFFMTHIIAKNSHVLTECSYINRMQHSNFYND